MSTSGTLAIDDSPGKHERHARHRPRIRSPGPAVVPGRSCSFVALRRVARHRALESQTGAARSSPREQPLQQSGRLMHILDSNPDEQPRRALCTELLGLAKREEEVAAFEAAAVHYWEPMPPSVA